MSIQSEVSRIDGTKGALKTAIEGKGVAVPEDTRIDGYAALVAEIPQGTGDMLASVYDPQNKAQDVFAYVDDSVPDITGKADKAVPTAVGNVAALDAEGNIQDSGKKPADFASATHNQAASTVTAGTFAGQVVANGSGQASYVSLLRNSVLKPMDAPPAVDGEIAWKYE